MRKYNPTNSKVSVDESGKVTFQDPSPVIEEEAVELEEATDLYDKDGIQITRYALGAGKGMGIQVSMDKRIALQSFTSSMNGGGYFAIHSQDLPKLLKAIQKASRAR